jgi:chemotaxis protein methyltransferase CheR
MVQTHCPIPSSRSDGTDMEISLEEFRSVAKLVKGTFGINLPESKRAMMSCRMFKVVRNAGCGSFSEFYSRFLVNPSPETLSSLANALSTNHTYFNRESSHFWYLRDTVLPELIRQQERRGKKDIRLWCAASSSGEEPYTLAMMIREALGSKADSWQGGLLATDISMKALESARRGIYPKDGAMELPENLFRKYFRDVGKGRSEVVPSLKKEVTFRRFNLMNRTYPFREPFHVVFCRNVMIYFEEHTKKEVVERIYDQTAPGGWLFVGHAETISGLGSRFRTVQPGIYRKD